MNLLVTGGCGFIASNFINYYYRSDINIINLDAMYYCANENNINDDIRYSRNYTFIKGNLQSKDLVSFILEKYSITHVIHFAAQSHVDNSFDNSLQYTMDNVVGTHTLLECCRIYAKIKKFIHVSTDEVYGETLANDLKNEQSVLFPTNPYAATKASAEMIVTSYIQSYKLPIIITRGNNVYGKNQYPEKLIPRFINLINSDKKLTIHGDGSAIRSFLHVDDVCKAFEIIIERGIVGEIYNIGTHDEYTVLEIAKILLKMMKGIEDTEEGVHNDITSCVPLVSDWIRYVPDRPFNDRRYFINSEKLKNLGWEPEISLHHGLELLI